MKEHEIFERQGDDLFTEIPVKFTLATLGGTIHVPTLQGKATLKIPAGTQSATTFRLKGRGMPHLRGGGSGDQLIRVQVEVPAKLSAEQKKMLEDFARISGDTEEPMSKGFFEKSPQKFFWRPPDARRHPRLGTRQQRGGDPAGAGRRPAGRGKAGRCRIFWRTKPEAGILALGPRFGVPAAFVDPAPFKTKLEGEGEDRFIAAIQAAQADLVVLAGFMRGF